MEGILCCSFVGPAHKLWGNSCCLLQQTAAADVKMTASLLTVCLSVSWNSYNCCHYWQQQLPLKYLSLWLIAYSCSMWLQVRISEIILCVLKKNNNKKQQQHHTPSISFWNILCIYFYKNNFLYFLCYIKNINVC